MGRRRRHPQWLSSDNSNACFQQYYVVFSSKFLETEYQTYIVLDHWVALHSLEFGNSSIFLEILDSCQMMWLIQLVESDWQIGMVLENQLFMAIPDLEVSNLKMSHVFVYEELEQPRNLFSSDLACYRKRNLHMISYSLSKYSTTKLT